MNTIYGTSAESTEESCKIEMKVMMSSLLWIWKGEMQWGVWWVSRGSQWVCKWNWGSLATITVWGRRRQRKWLVRGKETTIATALHYCRCSSHLSCYRMLRNVGVSCLQYIKSKIRGYSY
jgi:hypothetical protein